MLDELTFHYFLERQGSLRFFFFFLSLLQVHESPAYMKKTKLKEQLIPPSSGKRVRELHKEAKILHKTLNPSVINHLCTHHKVTV